MEELMWEDGNIVKRFTELDSGQDQDISKEEDEDSEENLEEHPDAETGKKQEDSDAEDLMYFTEDPDTEDLMSPDAENTDAEDSTIPTFGEEQVPTPEEAE